MFREFIIIMEDLRVDWENNHNNGRGRIPFSRALVYLNVISGLRIRHFQNPPRECPRTTFLTREMSNADMQKAGKSGAWNWRQGNPLRRKPWKKSIEPLEKMPSKMNGTPSTNPRKDQ